MTAITIKLLLMNIVIINNDTWIKKPTAWTAKNYKTPKWGAKNNRESRAKKERIHATKTAYAHKGKFQG